MVPCELGREGGGGGSFLLSSASDSEGFSAAEACRSALIRSLEGFNSPCFQKLLPSFSRLLLGLLCSV